MKEVKMPKYLFKITTSHDISVFISAFELVFPQWGHTQLTFTCSKPTVETLEKGVKYVQS